MTDLVSSAGGERDVEPFDRMLAFGGIVLIGLVIVALMRGMGEWGRLSPVIWAHLVTVVLGLSVVPVQLLRRKGDRMHRVLGRFWAVLLFTTALISFDIRDLNNGSFSFIHILSAVTIVSVPGLIWTARKGNIQVHRSIARSLTAGAMLTAGFFTLLPSRILGGWLFGLTG